MVNSIMLKAHAQAFLNAEEEAVLLGLARAGQSRARDALIMAHVRIAYAAAIDLKGYGFSIEDLFQQGILGLHQALDKFDEGHGVRFGRYAKPWVRGSMTRYIIENWSLLKVETRLYRKMFFVLRREQQSLSGMGVDFSALEPRLSDAKTRAELESVAPIILQGDKSLDAPFDAADEERGGSLIDVIADEGEGAVNVIDALNDRQLRDILRSAVDELPQAQREIIIQRYLQNDETNRKDLAESLGMSEDRVRRSERNAIEALRRIIAEKLGSDDFDDLL